jgi:hypothetical protein
VVVPANRTTVLGSVLPSQGVLFPSAARTATPTVPTEFGPTHMSVGITVRIDATAVAATPSVEFSIQGWDEAGQDWFEILRSVAVTAVGVTTMKVDPRIAAGANVAAQHGLVPRMRVAPIHGDADSITYSVTVFAHA